MALTSIVKLGDSYASETPPDHLLAIVTATLAAARKAEARGGRRLTGAGQGAQLDAGALQLLPGPAQE